MAQYFHSGNDVDSASNFETGSPYTSVYQYETAGTPWDSTYRDDSGCSQPLYSARYEVAGTSIRSLIAGDNTCQGMGMGMGVGMLSVSMAQ